MAHFPTRTELARLSASRGVTPRKTSFRRATDKLVIVPEPIWASRARYADSTVSKWLPELDSGSMKIGHQKSRRGGPLEFLGLAFNDPGDQSFADAVAFDPSLNAPVDPFLTS